MARAQEERTTKIFQFVHPKDLPQINEVGAEPQGPAPIMGGATHSIQLHAAIPTTATPCDFVALLASCIAGGSGANKAGGVGLDGLDGKIDGKIGGGGGGGGGGGAPELGALSPPCEVTVSGLTMRPDLNGCRARLEYLNPEGSHGQCTIKGSNEQILISIRHLVTRRPVTLCAVISNGGRTCLYTLGAIARHNIPTMILKGSGRLSNYIPEIWLRREHMPSSTSLRASLRGCPRPVPSPSHCLAAFDPLGPASLRPLRPPPPPFPPPPQL